VIAKSSGWPRMVNFSDETPQQELRLFVGYASAVLRLVQPGKTAMARVAQSLEAKAVTKDDRHNIHLYDLSYEARWMLWFTRKCCFSFTSLVSTMIYLETLIKSEHIVFHPCSWRTLWVNMMIVAEKFWEDSYIHPSHIIRSYTGSPSPRDSVEIQFYLLQGLRWSLNLDRWDFAAVMERLATTASDPAVTAAIHETAEPGCPLLISRPLPNAKRERRLDSEERRLLLPAKAVAAELERQAEELLDRAREAELEAKRRAKLHKVQVEAEPTLSGVVVVRADLLTRTDTTSGAPMVNPLEQLAENGMGRRTSPLRERQQVRRVSGSLKPSTTPVKEVVMTRSFGKENGRVSPQRTMGRSNSQREITRTTAAARGKMTAPDRGTQRHVGRRSSGVYDPPSSRINLAPRTSEVPRSARQTGDVERRASGKFPTRDHSRSDASTVTPRSRNEQSETDNEEDRRVDVAPLSMSGLLRCSPHDRWRSTTAPRASHTVFHR